LQNCRYFNDLAISSNAIFSDDLWRFHSAANTGRDCIDAKSTLQLSVSVANLTGHPGKDRGEQRKSGWEGDRLQQGQAVCGVNAA